MADPINDPAADPEAPKVDPPKNDTPDDRVLKEGQIAIASEYFNRIKREREDAQAKLRQIEADREKAEADRLKEQGEFQKLAEAAEKRAAQREQELADLKASHQADRVRLKLEALAGVAGMFDPEDISHIDLSGVSLDDSGAVVGAKEAIDALKVKKPYLFKPEKVEPDGKRTTPVIPVINGDPGPGPRNAASMDPAEFKKAMFEKFRVAM